MPRSNVEYPERMMKALKFIANKNGQNRIGEVVRRILHDHLEKTGVYQEMEEKMSLKVVAQPGK